MVISTSRVWAKPLAVDGNVVCQLLVVEDRLEVVDDAGDLVLRPARLSTSWPHPGFVATTR
jgi:hypothetical protein